MRRIPVSEAYTVGSLVTLGILLLIDNSLAMLIGSVVGLALGLWLGSRHDLRRAGMVAGVAFAVAIVLSVLAMAR